MLVRGECWQVSGRRVIGIVIPEDESSAFMVMIAVFDHAQCRLGDEELFEVQLRTVNKQDSPFEWDL